MIRIAHRQLNQYLDMIEDEHYQLNEVSQVHLMIILENVRHAS
jgi:hypothetical protein